MINGEFAMNDNDVEDNKVITKMGVFEEYRRLSYHLNREDKFEARGIQKMENGNYTVTAPNDDGIDTEYEVIRIKTSHSDLVPFILIPKNRNPDEPCKVRLTFQGTSSMMGWNRNFTGIGSAGINEFENDKASMVQQLDNALKNIPNVDLSIIGHSLGGADSQNMMVEVMKYMNNEGPDYYQNKLQNVNNLQLCVFNSAGVRETTARESEEYANKLREKNKGIDAYFSIIGGDIVQQVGEANILANMQPEVGSLHVVKTKTDKENYWSAWTPHKAVGAGLRTFEAHIGHWYTPPEQAAEGLDNAAQARERLVFSNSNPEGQQNIRLRLQEHKLINAYPKMFALAQGSKKGLRALEDLFNKFSSDPKQIAPATQNDIGLIMAAFAFIQHDTTTDQIKNFEEIIDEVVNHNPLIIRAMFEVPVTEDGLSIVNWFAKNGQSTLLDKILSKDREYGLNSINLKDASGKTPLYHAVENGHADCIRVLRKYDANVNHAGPENSSVLPVAVKTGHLELVDTILDSKPTALNSKIIQKISRYSPDQEGNSVFHMLAMSEEPLAANLFVKTLIDRARVKGKPYSFYMQDIKNKDNKSVLDLLIENGRTDILNALSEKKYYKDTIDFEKENHLGFKPIEYALYSDKKDLAESFCSNKSGFWQNFKLDDVQNQLNEKIQKRNARPKA